jgi:hypothetical protein
MKPLREKWSLQEAGQPGLGLVLLAAVAMGAAKLDI